MHEVKKRNEGRYGMKGFTQVELMIVIIVLVVLTGIAIPTYMIISGRAREAAVESEMINIGKALEMYRNDSQEYPLPAAYPDAIEDGDYMAIVPIIDAWENDYQYSSDGSNYTLESFGINGINGGNDDIVISNGVLIEDGAYDN